MLMSANINVFVTLMAANINVFVTFNIATQTEHGTGEFMSDQ